MTGFLSPTPKGVFVRSADNPFKRPIGKPVLDEAAASTVGLQLTGLKVLERVVLQDGTIEIMNPPKILTMSEGVMT